MPKISVSKRLLYSLLAGTPNAAALEPMLVCAKAELDGEDETSFKVELNDTNRPDLWTTAGLARQLALTKYGKALPEYKFFTAPPAKDKHIIADASVKPVRPFVAGFIMRGKTVDAELLEELIQMQEKLCENFGRRRKALAIGLYREDKISWPVTYRAEDPASSRFTPLGESREMTLSDIAAEHPKGKEYGHLLRGLSRYPLLRDAKNHVLSMPPVINSAYLGAVQAGDSALFVECTGESQEMLLLACAIFACDCADMGFAIERVRTQYDYQTPFGAEVLSPQYFQKSIVLQRRSAADVLGEDLKTDDIVSALKAAGVRAEAKGEEFTVHPPAYRNDFLHEADAIEEIMIGRGADSFAPAMPKNFTIGRLHPIEHASRRALATMVGLGFQEMLFPYLGSAQMFIRAMVPADAQDAAARGMVRISNPISENYEYVRASALPQLLEAERVSANSPYPHKLFEIGKVALRDETENYGARTDTMLTFLTAGAQANFSEINSVISALLYYEGVAWRAEAPAAKNAADSRFIDGRCAHIVRETDGAVLGVFGEIHPRVLEAFDITMPCAGGEIRLDFFIAQDEAAGQKSGASKKGAART